jgi:hypothetical protein
MGEWDRRNADFSHRHAKSIRFETRGMNIICSQKIEFSDSADGQCVREMIGAKPSGPSKPVRPSIPNERQSEGAQPVPERRHARDEEQFEAPEHVRRAE